MSLDVYLILPSDDPKPIGTGVFVREGGSTIELTAEQVKERFPGYAPMPAIQDAGDEVYWRNITHNLGKMASEAGLYEALWRPEEKGWVKAKQLVDPIAAGLAELVSDPDRYKKLNPENGWGSYDGLVEFAQDYLMACIKYPEADVRVSR